MILDDCDRNETKIIYKQHKARQLLELSEEEFEDAYEEEWDAMFDRAFEMPNNPQPWIEEEQDEPAP